MIKFRVNGTPAPQGSKRHVGGGRMIEMSKAVGPWREAVRAETQRYLAPHEHTRDPRNRAGWPAAVRIVFILPRPAAHYGRRSGQRYVKDSAPGYPTTRPDVDKLARAVLDGLVAGGLFADDAQVAVLYAAKRYASDADVPGALIEVETL